MDWLLTKKFLSIYYPNQNQGKCSLDRTCSCFLFSLVTVATVCNKVSQRIDSGKQTSVSLYEFNCSQVTQDIDGACSMSYISQPHLK